MKLHIGCGEVRLPGYVNIDIRYLPNVDIVDNAKFLRRFKKESIQEIYACHILEHFLRWEIDLVLKRWYDVLEYKGILRLAVPDFKAIVDQYNSSENIEELLGLLYGGQDYDENKHHMCWDFSSLKKHLEEIGFTLVEKYDWKTTETRDIDDYSKCYFPHMDFENGRLMSLNILARKE